MFRGACFCSLVAVLFIGCGDDAPFDVRIIDTDGGNPVAGTDATAVTLQVRQQTFTPIENTFPVTEGTFDASVALQSFLAPTTMRVEIAGATTRLIGAPPIFVPNQVTPSIRLLVGEPSTCSVVDRPTLLSGRSAAGSARVAHFSVIVGGAAEDPQVELVDLVALVANRLTNTDLPELGRTETATLAFGVILALPESAEPFILSTNDPNQRVTPVTLHAGAAPGSTVVPFNDGEGWVIGGAVSGTPQNAISIVRGDTIAPSLLVPRENPVVVTFDESLVVVGGDDAGTAEIVTVSGSTVLADFSDGVRRDPIVVRDDESFLVMGGTDGGGAIRQDTVLFTGCPSACDPMAGPTWTTAREGLATLLGTPFIVGGEGSQLVERVDFSNGSAAISMVSELEVPRADATIDVMESGVVIVMGGESTEGARQDIEYCFPSDLEAL